MKKFYEWVEKYQIGPGMNDKEGLYSGFDGAVGDGWVPIIDRLAADLIAMGWDKNLYQVKEKFGSLRFYIGSGTEEMYNRIREAELESLTTCTDCGSAAGGRKNDRGWIFTLCDPCRAKMQENK